MKTLTKRMKAKQQKGETIFVPYLMAGAQGLDQLETEIQLLTQAGATAIEIGIPFSDPVADGPVIQAAGLRALHNEVTLTKIIKQLQRSQTTTPLIIMTYFNPLFIYGVERFFKELGTTNVKGLIIPDLPFEHTSLVEPFLQQSDVALIPLVALTSSPERIVQLVTEAEGFVYAVAVNGVTGVGTTYQDCLDAHLALIQTNSELPVLAGFGISTRAQVERFRNSCAGVVVGSKIVQLLGEGNEDAVRVLVQALTKP